MLSWGTFHKQARIFLSQSRENDNAAFTLLMMASYQSTFLHGPVAMKSKNLRRDGFVIIDKLYF